MLKSSSTSASTSFASSRPGNATAGSGKDPRTTSDASAAIVQEKVRCQLCDSSHDNERLFVRHLSLKHFTEQLCRELSKNPPYYCPDI